MALPFLPEAEIVPIFERLQRQATTECLSDFMEYVSHTWVHRNASWPPSCWSIYLRSVRTNNDVEGWHHGLNRRGHRKTRPQKDAAALLRANPAAARRRETHLAADPLSFREEIEENAAQRLPSTTIKNLYPVGGIQVRREDEQAAPTGLRMPVWSTRHIIPVALTVVYRTKRLL